MEHIGLFIGVVCPMENSSGSSICLKLKYIKRDILRG